VVVVVVWVPDARRKGRWLNGMRYGNGRCHWQPKRKRAHVKVDEELERGMKKRGEGHSNRLVEISQEDFRSATPTKGELDFMRIIVCCGQVSIPYNDN
jgi:hypothetical protein